MLSVFDAEGTVIIIFIIMIMTIIPVVVSVIVSHIVILAKVVHPNLVPRNRVRNVNNPSDLFLPSFLFPLNLTICSFEHLVVVLVRVLILFIIENHWRQGERLRISLIISFLGVKGTEIAFLLPNSVDFELPFEEIQTLRSLEIFRDRMAHHDLIPFIKRKLFFVVLPVAPEFYHFSPESIPTVII